jgi:transposase-like protein
VKKSKLTEEQTAFALRQAETGTRVAGICRKFGIAEQTFCRWKNKYGGLGISQFPSSPPLVHAFFPWGAARKPGRPPADCGSP